MIITDGVNELYIYGTYSSDGKLRYSELEDKPIQGDEVVILGALNVYNGTPQVKSGWIQDFKHVEPDYSEKDYPVKSVLEARSAASSTKLTVEGVVGFVTYANGFVADGFYLIDNTSSIYVHGEIASQVKVGNKVKLYGTKEYFIAENEKENAKKYSYIGSNQINGIHILQNDNGSHEFDKTWIKESTVKQILDSPFDSDITNLIFKVNAFVRKVPGSGFTNYYIKDLDDETSSYVYTKCNGSDFSYLDDFDGKICTVYLTAENAKSTATGCMYRFIPVLVKDENFTFNLENAPDYIFEYAVKKQFISEYKGDPSLELLTSFSYEALGIENAIIKYKSLDEKIISIENTTDKTIMHVLSTGKCNLEVEITVGNFKKTYTYEINSNMASNIEYISIKEAFDKPENEIVIVKGIVASSITNKNTGFFLIDETSLISVILDSEAFKDIHLGDEIIIKGTRSYYENKGVKLKQSYLKDCEVLVNNYGNNTYSKNSFKDSTVENLCSLDYSNDISNQVYKVHCFIKKVETPYYTNYYIEDLSHTTNNLSLYAASGAQYAFLDSYMEKEVIVDIVPVNWNNKNRFCVLAVYDLDGSNITINDVNFK